MMRINARLDPDSEEKIKRIKNVTNKSTTDIIKKSVDLYYQQISFDAKSKNQKLLKSLSGISDGPEDLSSNYKNYLNDDLEKKHDSR